ncbi:MAG: 3D domain-containing protein [Bacillota bacterium]|nr:3D domain-containing protein [Bacillota bacterium]
MKLQEREMEVVRRRRAAYAERERETRQVQRLEQMRRRKRREMVITLMLIFIALLLMAAAASSRRQLIVNRERHEAAVVRLAVAQQEKESLERQLLEAQAEITSVWEEREALAREAAAMAEVLAWDRNVMELTHYAPLDPEAVEGMCYAGNPRVTASGEATEIGLTVAASRGIPFGTRVYIPGYGFRTVQDRGGAIIEGRLDIAVASRLEALQLGRLVREVYIEGDLPF